jgi:hypothetical protein
VIDEDDIKDALNGETLEASRLAYGVLGLAF